MHPRSPKALEDIRDAAAFIIEVTAGATLDGYRRDRLLRQAHPSSRHHRQALR